MSDVAYEGPPPDGVLGFVHVDMDAFFVSCELLRRPELRTEPVVVGGTGDRGVVAAASYVARSYGIHSAMPSSRARRLCPHAVFLPGDHAYYAEVSRRVMAVFADVTPYVEPLSLDEAFLDVRGPAQSHRCRRDCPRHPSSDPRPGRTDVLDRGRNGQISGEARHRRGQTSSDSAGPVFGSGVHVVEPGRELAFLHPKPARELWGVGPKTGEKLARIGIETIGDLAAQPLDRLTAALGSATGAHLHQLAHARDPRPVIVDSRSKSIGHEETFPRDLTDRSVLSRELIRMVDAVATRLHKAGVAGRTIQLKLRFGDFTTITRSATITEPTDKAM